MTLPSLVLVRAVACIAIVSPFWSPVDRVVLAVQAWRVPTAGQATAPSVQHGPPAAAHAPVVSDAVTGARGQISAYVRKVFQDRDGHFWFGTNDDGVCRFDGKALEFFGPREGLAGRAVRGIVQDQAGAVWIATEGGVSRFDRNVFTTFRLGESASDNDAWSLLLDRSGTIWVGTLTGVRRLDGTAFVPFPLPKAQVASGGSLVGPGVVLDMIQDHAGNIWFGTDGAGAHRYNGDAFLSYTTADGLGSSRVLCLHADRRGRIWIGTEGGGVTCIDGAAMRTYSAKDGLGNNRVWDVLEDRQGAVWFATLGAGVACFDGTAFAVFGAEYGLTPDHVQNLFEDRNGVLWLGCSGGLFRRDGTRFVNITRDGPWSAEPLAAFTRLVGGRWKMTTQAGKDTYDTWQWGPGKQSIRALREGALTSGEAWRELTVYYWHPAHNNIRLLGMGSVLRGVSEGTISFDGDTAESVFELHQTGSRRDLRVRWLFDGLDKYHDDLFENVGDEYELLSGWDRFRVDAAEPDERLVAPSPTPAPKPSEMIRPLDRLLDRAWESSLALDATALPWSGFSRVRTTFEHQPYLDAIYGRVETIGDDGAATHAMDVYLYHHTGARVLRCLALSGRGADGATVYEGEITPSDDGRAISIRFNEHRSAGKSAMEACIEFESDATARQRVWTLDGHARTIVMDRRHHAARR